ncbi:MAG: hypothetical protein E7473_07470 [Ruminococcaceae bacterium]|nr:hypothetical protein [Oscillospiraceae bacterium]
MKKIIAMIMSVLMMVTLLCGCGGGGASSPEDAVENFLDAALDADIEAMIDCMPPQISENFADAAENLGTYDLDEMEEELRDEMPEDASYEVKDKEEMSDDEVKALEEELSAMAAQLAMGAEFDMDALKDMDEEEGKEKLEEFEEDCKVEIEEAYYVEVELTADGETNTEKFPVGKIDGDWYILAVNF